MFVLIGICKIIIDNGGKAKSLKGIPAEVSAFSIEEIASVSSVSAADMQAAADLLSRDSDSIVALASGFGFYDRSDLVGVSARLLAQMSGSSFFAALAGANSRGIHDLIARNRQKGGMSASKIIESAVSGTVKAIINFGVDIDRCFPGGMGTKAIENLEFLLSTSVFPNGTTEKSNAVLPVALWLENSGTTVNMFGSSRTLEPVMPPPNNVKTGSEILDLLIALLRENGLKAGEASGIEIQKYTLPEEIDEVKGLLSHYLEIAATGERIMLIPGTEFVHSGDGSITRFLTWSRLVCPHPEAVIPVQTNGSSKKSLNLKLGSNGIEHIIPFKKGKRASEGSVVVPHHFREIRELFAWEYIEKTDYLNLKPPSITIEFV